MKFSCQVTINLPREQVVKLWDNADNLKKWQEGLVSFEHETGEPGAVGATSKIIYKQGKGQFEMIETILSNNLPEEFVGEYYHKDMTNTMVNKFQEISEDQTKWTADIHYSAFRGFFPNLMGIFFKGMFRKQTQKWLDRFKTFAENEAGQA